MNIDINDIKKKFGQTLKSIRKKKKLTQITLAVKCDLDNSQISKLERGVWDIQLSTIIILAQGLEIEPKELLDFKI
ncbi:helix-turn-helix domain-containing protein [Mucilaginibacter sp.]|uniref:helix-turn-helix domain-containing protein n=1 Tax=Mucilaginibacter sp. TaxID=1882438 RepID=UPI0039C9B602